MTKQDLLKIRDSEAEKYVNNDMSFEVYSEEERADAWMHFNAGFDCRDKLDNEALKLAVEAFRVALITKVNQHRLAYSHEFFPNSIELNDSSSRDSVGANMGRHMCDCFLRYIDEALAEIREMKGEV